MPPSFPELDRWMATNKTTRATETLFPELGMGLEASLIRQEYERRIRER